jgi:hypothetical protein
MTTRDHQATLNVIRQTRAEVQIKKRRVEAFTAVDEPPPAHLLEDLRTDQDYLAYLETLVNA